MAVLRDPTARDAAIAAGVPANKIVSLFVDRVPGGVCEEIDKNTPPVGGDQVQGGDSLHLVDLNLPVRRRWMARHAP